MAKFLPFHALMPPPEKVAAVAAVPYDVVNTEEAAALADGNPLSFLRVSRPEIELAPGTDLYSDEVYARAAANFKRLRREAPLAEDPEANLYVYSLKMGEHTQVGIAGAASAAEYDAGVIKKHEKTRRDKEDDRARHVMELRNHSGPVFLTYRDSASIDAMVHDIMKARPYFSFTAPDGIEHKLWKAGAEKSRELSRIFETEVPCFYIADGHHRSAAAALVGAEKAKQNPNHRGDEEYNYFMAVCFPANQLTIIDYNRVVKDLNGLTPAQFLEAVSRHFDVEEKGAEIYKPACLHNFSLYLDGKWYSLTAKPGTYDDNDPIGVLDVTISSNLILDEILGIKDLRSDKRIDFVGGIRGLGELKRRVDSGEMKMALALYPVSMKQLMDIADTGNIMPPKTTWFEPKLRSGLIIHKLS